MAKSFARSYGSLDRCGFVRSSSCVTCGGGPCENAHVTRIDAGVGRKGHYTGIAPLCAKCHRRQHEMGTKSFENCYQIDLAAEAADVQRRWVAFNGGVDPCALLDNVAGND